MTYETIRVEVVAGVATITLNRPEKLNAFSLQMTREFNHLWRNLKDDAEVRCIVLQAEGRGFCSGVDIHDGGFLREPIVWDRRDPGEDLSPKQNGVWKPLIVAVHGICAGGAFYWLNDAEICICAEDAQFFDPHVTFGRTAVLEPIGLLGRVGLGEILRMTLLGNDERISAATALRIGLVSEVTTAEALRGRAQYLASRIAEKPPTAVQGSLRAIYAALDMPRSVALSHGIYRAMLGNPDGMAEHQAAAPPAAHPGYDVR